MPLTTEDLQNRLSDITNVFIMFSVFFVILLLVFIFKARNNNLTFFKNRKKLNLNKENNQDSISFVFFKNVFMGISFVVVLFSELAYSNGKEMLAKAQSDEVVMGWKAVSLTEIKDKITIDNDKLTIDRLTDNFYYKDSTISKNEKQAFEIDRFLFSNEVLRIIHLDEDDEPDTEYKISAKELKEIKENR